jgi:hypothetical protein
MMPRRLPSTQFSIQYSLIIVSFEEHTLRVLKEESEREEVPYEPQLSIEDSAGLHPGFHFFGFRNHDFILQRQVVSLASIPPTWRTRSLYLCPPSDRVAQL